MQKTMLLLVLLIVAISCTSKSINNKTPTEPKDKAELKYEIVNHLLKELVPHELIQNKENFQTIFVNDQLLYLDSNTIDKFIKLGGSPLLENMKGMQFSTDLYLHKLTGFDHILVAQTYPLTSVEMNQTIGKITFSRICFNKKQNKVAFVYEFFKSRNHPEKKSLSR